MSVRESSRVTAEESSPGRKPGVGSPKRAESRRDGTNRGLSRASACRAKNCPQVTIRMNFFWVTRTQGSLHFQGALEGGQQAKRRKFRVREHFGESTAVGQSTSRVFDVHKVVAKELKSVDRSLQGLLGWIAKNAKQVLSRNVRYFTLQELVAMTQGVIWFFEILTIPAERLG